MLSQRLSLSAAGVLAACLFSFPVYANKGGIVGYSGKSGSTVTCMTAGCHGTNSSPSTPTVELSGPTTLAAGTTGNYSLTIRGGPAVKGGMDVAVSDSTAILGTTGGDLQVISKELTHTAPKDFVNNELRFDFSMVAPSSSRTITLFASGNSTNNSVTSDGDHAASTRLDIQVTGSSTPPDAGTPDAGTPDPGTPDEKGGCSTTAGAPLALMLALVAERLRRRAS